MTIFLPNGPQGTISKLMVIANNAANINVFIAAAIPTNRASK
jgi:hypothetical protein